MKRFTIPVVVLSLIAFGSVETSRAQSQIRSAAKPERHPLIRKALAALHNAADDLEDASKDFCGHRETALDAVNVAIDQLGLAIACDRNSAQSMSVIESVGQSVAQAQTEIRAAATRERHPLIRKALAALHNAAIDLEDASKDFCGHREAALDAVDRAIDQLGLAIACDK
jgi:hypothetical protein